MTEGGLTTFSSDIRTWAKYEIAHTPTLIYGIVKDIHYDKGTVSVSIQIWDRINKLIKEEAMRNVRYVDSYLPHVGDEVVIAYIEKKYPVVIARLATPGTGYTDMQQWVDDHYVLKGD